MRDLMNVLKWSAAGGALMLTAMACVVSKTHETMTPTPAAPVAMTPLERGHNLVMNTAACVSCHRMTLPASEPAPIRKGTRPPDLAKLSADNLNDVTAMIEGGRTPNAMPEYHMSHEDSTAVVTYLKSLNTTPAAGGGNGS